MTVDTPHFRSDLMNEIIEEAWQSESPKNGLSIVKSFLKNHYQAMKNDKYLPIPEKCRGYKIIKNKLVYFGEDSEISKEKYRCMNVVDQSKTMLNWMQFLKEKIRNLTLSECVLEITDIDNAHLPDSFLDEDVDICILQNFMKKSAFEQLQQRVQDKKTKQKFTCIKCSKSVHTNCIQCDSCLLWFHYSCVNIEVPKNALYFSDHDWYCCKCNSI
ncbi:uncharacterized protein LOC100679388 [Nasonia vitripennis]|uniref:PHD-type domain-containing protein n=1 Tax=Nasonia vitripennis TaxID=7425 RepID=A0A7M7Q2F9_NASVI|nr:uncharacterized protein LOC100679388 [Nasonia vitripennis]